MGRTQVSGTTIRRAGSADSDALSDFFAGLSVQTRYRRFFAPVTPTPAMLRMLSGGAGNVHALIAIREGIIIGHAMAADQAGPAGSLMTDIGVVIADAWQGLGLGSALTRTLLAAAQARGVTSVAMEVLHSNSQVLAMIASHWPAVRTGHGSGFATVHVPLAHPPRQRPPAGLSASLPAAASQEQHSPRAPLLLAGASARMP